MAGSRLIAAAAALTLPLWAGCGGDDTPSVGETLRLSEEAALNAGSYRIEVTGHDLVLPEWGGVDSGEVLVDMTRPAASAKLERTGDGAYEMILAGGETVFKRSTCDHFQRVSGGGGGVLQPFIWNDAGILGALSKAQYAVGAGKDVTVILAESATLGPVQIDLDRKTLLPTRAIVGKSEWHFRDWGTLQPMRKPDGSFKDQGPGGNPC